MVESERSERGEQQYDVWIVHERTEFPFAFVGFFSSLRAVRHYIEWNAGEPEVIITAQMIFYRAQRKIYTAQWGFVKFNEDYHYS